MNEKFAHICVAGHAVRCAFSPPNLQQCSCVHRSFVWCEMRLLCWEQAMCERDAPAAVIFRAACLSRALPVDASRQALSGWGRSTWSFHVNLLSTTHIVFFLIKCQIKKYKCIHETYVGTCGIQTNASTLKPLNSQRHTT